MRITAESLLKINKIFDIYFYDEKNPGRSYHKFRPLGTFRKNIEGETIINDVDQLYDLCQMNGYKLCIQVREQDADFSTGVHVPLLNIRDRDKFREQIEQQAYETRTVLEQTGLTRGDDFYDYDIVPSIGNRDSDGNARVPNIYSIYYFDNFECLAKAWNIAIKKHIRATIDLKRSEFRELELNTQNDLISFANQVNAKNINFKISDKDYRLQKLISGIYGSDNNTSTQSNLADTIVYCINHGLENVTSDNETIIISCNYINSVRKNPKPRANFEAILGFIGDAISARLYGLEENDYKVFSNDELQRKVIEWQIKEDTVMIAYDCSYYMAQSKYNDQTVVIGLREARVPLQANTPYAMAREINKLIYPKFKNLVGQDAGMRMHSELFRLNEYNNIDDEDKQAYMGSYKTIIQTIKDYLSTKLSVIGYDDYYIAFVKISQKKSHYDLNDEKNYCMYANTCYENLKKNHEVSRTSEPLHNLISFSKQPGFSLGTVLTSGKYDTYAIRFGFGKADNDVLQYQHIWNTAGHGLDATDAQIYNDLDILSKIASRTFAVGNDTRINISSARNYLQEEIYCCVMRYVLNNGFEISKDKLRYLTRLDIDTEKNNNILDDMRNYATNLPGFFERNGMFSRQTKFLVIPTATRLKEFTCHPYTYGDSQTLGLYDYNPAYKDANNPVMLNMLKFNNIINDITKKLGKFAMYKDYITPADAYFVDETKLDDVIKSLEDIEKRIDAAIANKEDGNIMAFHDYLQKKNIVGISLKKNAGTDTNIIKAVNYKSENSDVEEGSGVDLDKYYNVSFEPATRPNPAIVSSSYKLKIMPKYKSQDPLKVGALRQEYTLNIRSNSAGDNITLELQGTNDKFFAGKMMTFFNKTLDKVGFANDNLFIKSVNKDNVNKDDDVYNNSLERIANTLGTTDVITMKGIRAFCKQGDMKAVNNLHSAYCDTMIELADDQSIINGILSSYADDKVTTPKLVQIYMLYYTLWHMFFDNSITDKGNIIYNRETGKEGRTEFLSNYIRDFIATGLRTNILNSTNSGFTALPYIK